MEMRHDRRGSADAELGCTVTDGRPAIVQAPPHDEPAGAYRWLDQVRPELRDALDAHGAVYLRGLAIRSHEDFALVRDALVSERATYQEKATPRSAFGDGVFSSTDLPPSQPIRLHNENSYTLTFPGTLLFCCLVAPEHGGATPVADCRSVLANLPDDLAERFRTLGWTLTRNFSEHISLDWRTAFGVTSPAEAQRYCDEHLISCDWRDGDHLRTTQRRSATIHHPVTGEEVWFNHAAFWSEWSLEPDVREALITEFGPDGLPFGTAFGDGTPIGPAEVAALHDAYDRATVRESWSPGDLLIVDNVLAAHGREAFRGDRRIAVAMGDPRAVEDCKPTVAPGPGLAP
jgi:alpha-ketoglutarate-dependent taurine dioxygenase